MYYIKSVFGGWVIRPYTIFSFRVDSFIGTVYGPYDTYEEAKEKADELNISSPPDNPFSL